MQIYCVLCKRNTVYIVLNDSCQVPQSLRCVFVPKKNRLVLYYISVVLVYSITGERGNVLLREDQHRRWERASGVYGRNHPSLLDFFWVSVLYSEQWVLLYRSEVNTCNKTPSGSGGWKPCLELKNWIWSGVLVDLRSCLVNVFKIREPLLPEVFAKLLSGNSCRDLIQ